VHRPWHRLPVRSRQRCPKPLTRVSAGPPQGRHHIPTCAAAEALAACGWPCCMVLPAPSATRSQRMCSVYFYKCRCGMHHARYGGLVIPSLLIVAGASVCCLHVWSALAMTAKSQYTYRRLNTCFLSSLGHIVRSKLWFCRTERVPLAAKSPQAAMLSYNVTGLTNASQSPVTMFTDPGAASPVHSYQRCPNP
jgi:hypothetical protein